MLSHNFSNLAVERTLTSAMDGSQTTATFSSLTGFPAYPYFVVVDRDNASIEVLQVTGLNSGNTVNVVRGYGDTSPIAHSSGAKVLHVAPAEFFQDVLAAINNAPVVTRFYTANATWTKPTDDTFKGVIVELQGGGGGSGGNAATTSTQTSSAGGGKGGAYARFWVPAASLGATESVTVGAGGTAGAAGANNGGDGGSSSFGAHGTAPGGQGGAGGAAATPSWTSQAGGSTVQNFSGSASNVIFVRGGDGGYGYRLPGTGVLAAIPGYGGGSHLGGQQAASSISANKITAQAGQLYGGGAAAGALANTQSAAAGAAGGAGCVIVTEYYG